MGVIYANDIGERTIPIGEAWELTRWYLQPPLPPPTGVRILWKGDGEVCARVVLGAILATLGCWLAVLV